MHVAAAGRRGGAAAQRCAGVTCARPTAAVKRSKRAARLKLTEAQRDAWRITTAAWREMVEADRDAWRKPPGASVTGDRWTDAAIAAGNGDIEPLANYLKNAGAGREPALTQQQLDNLASLLRWLHARGQKGPRGKPGGTLWRWQDPNYVATQFAEVRIAIWKRDNGRRNIPDTIRDKIIADTVAEISEWHFAKRKPPSVNGVMAILKGPRSRRLPVVLPGPKRGV